MAVILWGAPITDTPTWTPALSGLAAYASSISSVIDNTVGLYENAMFNFVSSTASAATPGSGVPYIAIYALYAPDGVTYPTPPGAAAGNVAAPQSATVLALSGATFTSGHSLPFLLAPMKFRLMLANVLGVALPTGTITATLNRWAETVA